MRKVGADFGEDNRRRQMTSYVGSVSLESMESKTTV